MVNKLGDITTTATTVKVFWRLVLESLQDSQFDVPFALLYSVGEGEDVDRSSVSSGSTMSSKSCHLEGAIGVTDGHAVAALHLDLKRSQHGFVPSFRDAMRSREPTHIQTRDGTLPDLSQEGINARGYGEPCREAIVFPVRPTNGDAVLAFLVVGVNPRRPYDSGYAAFANLLHRQLATSLASVILFEEEIRRSRDAVEAAALEKAELTQQLNLQASRLRRMTEVSPLGMFLISLEGVLREGNDRFYEMTGLSNENQDEMSWMDFILESSIETMKEGWQILTKKYLPWTGELQLKRQGSGPVDLVGAPIDYWVLFIAQIEYTSEGTPRSITGSITEISHLKWAQGLQSRQLREAEETRRQQNEFIDITSHEMRNPLSAILQCADDISSTLGACVSSDAVPSQTIIESCIDAALTITLCVQHQKSIVDDILTVSKLDSNLLHIAPTVCQPEAILHRVLKMFEAEVKAKGISLILEIHPSYKELKVDWATLDPSRVIQILVNLMTNAIKFTASSEKRIINLAIGASLEPPDGKHIPGFEFVPSQPHTSGVTDSEVWGHGEILYLRFRVLDTGCGLTDEEMQRLFQRFKQASPRTHAQYGGSGLGLFISKRLSELHGGMIGVASQAGKGSQFGFYVQARRSDPLESSSIPSPALVLVEPRLGITLPIRKASEDEHTSLSHLLSGQRSVSPTLVESQENQGLHILVVEDNLINQTVLVRQLKKEGCIASAASDGIEALHFLKQTQFCRDGKLGLSLILMDLEMPNMDGLTCIREIRRMEREGTVTRHVPVIAVTANVRDEQVKTALESGMDDLVSKPFRIRELLEKINLLLERLRKSSEGSSAA